MGTNYYIRKVKPIEVRPEFHIGKRSCGWKPLFESYHSDAPYGYNISVDRPYVDRVSDIKALVESGEWEIIDEYDNTVTYDQFIDHMDTDYDIETERKSHLGIGIDAHRGVDGREYTDEEFS